MLSKGQPKAHQKLTVMLLFRMPNCTLMMLWEDMKTWRSRWPWWSAETLWCKLRLRSWELLWSRQREAAKWLNKSWWMPVSVLGCCTLRLGHVVFTMKYRTLRASFKCSKCCFLCFRTQVSLTARRSLRLTLFRSRVKLTTLYRKPETLRTRPKRPSLMWESVAAKWFTKLLF